MQRIGDLLFRRLQGTLEGTEAAELEQWLQQQPEEHRQFYTTQTTWPAIEAGLQRFYDIDQKAALADVWQRIHPTQQAVAPSAIRLRWVRRAAAAAAILIVVGTSIAWFLHHSRTVNSTELPLAARYKSNALPGGNKATLELSDGSVVVLDSAKNGTLARQGDALVRKDTAGTLSYEATGKQPGSIAFNRITTPRGGEYQVVLPDGTKVWLNAASSLRYPTAFAGKEREVELSGEAYFEVAPDAAKHFRVIVAGPEAMRIDVLGTAFNIKAYAGEPTRKATLVQGKVSITNGQQQTLLAPGQQAALRENSPQIAVQPTDLDAVLAWKNGLFYLEDASITDVMREISRWYDVDIQYEGHITQQFVGKIPRNMPLVDVLKILESTGWVHFQVNGRMVTVTP